jgi:hypothetical protein
VFGVGLSRTGTLSLSRALSMLGIVTSHYPNDPTTQDELKDGRYALTLLRTVQAITDIPAAPFYPQLDQAFPGSRFILTTRETEAWLASVERHFSMYVDRRRDAFDDFMFACVYGSLSFSAERFRYVRDLHERNVRSYFADRPEDLLILDVSEPDPWGVLCGFLGRPVPPEPYPHVNKALAEPVALPGTRARIARRVRSLTRR